ncbi:MucBP domain-containing protein [Streptococcus thoraltensis]|uniref:MucBP domain-containing protein n=1 Tax=Streptococcus thoraltensis TaxID=55085 RepID=UPI002A82C94F|nr:MucBP domain-containing protein [Streptococcus thoraltensis]MDY4760483.1 MucBP domain-containing protein [Streptococcus thoraltensis]
MPLGLSNDGRYAYALGFTSDINVADRTTINAIYRYDMQTQKWSVASDARTWADGMGVMATNAWTAGAVNPKDGRYYFGTLTLKTDPAFSQVAPGTEAAYQKAKTDGTFDLYFRMWSFDPATGTVANAGYLDTNLVKSGSFDKEESYYKQLDSYVVGNDIAFDTEGNMKLIMNQYNTANYFVYSVDGATFDAATAGNNKYSKIEGKLSDAIPISTDITTIDATNNEILQKENQATTGGLAVDSDGSLLFHSRQGKVGLIRPDLKYGGILTNVKAPTDTATWGDAASIRGTVGTGNVYREYYIKDTDTILSGTVGDVVDFKFVPTLETTTGKDTIEKDQALYHEYDATVGRPKAIRTADGTVYRYVGVKTGSDSETGTVKKEDQTVKYEYERVAITGNVIVKYVDVNGNTIKDPVYDEENADAGEPYDTNVDHKLDLIKGKDGKTYELVPKGTYTVGEVDDNGHLTSSDETTGKVEAGSTKEVTYVYREVPTQKAGDVVLHYVDTKGNELQPNHHNADDKPIGTDYTVTAAEKPETIEKDGVTYKKVETSATGTVGDRVIASENVTTEETGKIIDGTKNIVYVYKPVGSVVIHYVNTKGQVIKEVVKDITEGDLDTAYNAADNKEAAEEKPQTITKDGVKYNFKEVAASNVVGTTTVVTTDKTNVLGQETGKVVAGTTHVIYVYDEETPEVPETPVEVKNGSVIVNYVDVDGKFIKPSVFDEKNQPEGTPYDTTDDNRPTTILGNDGKIYDIVAASEQTVGVVDYNGRLTTPAGGQLWPASDEETGQVAGNMTKNITYVYKVRETVQPEVKNGSVEVTYEDTEGNIIKAPETDVDVAPVGTKYETLDHKPEKIETENNGEKSVYYLKEHKSDSAPESGEVVEGVTRVTYVYEKAGSVEVKYVDETGKELKPLVKAVTDAKPGTDYDTTTATLRPSQITTDDGKVYELVPEGNYAVGNTDTNGHLTTTDTVNGQVEAGKTKSITYVYKLKEETPTTPETPVEKVGSVVVHYVNTEGQTIQSDYKDTVDAPVGSSYDTTETKLEKPDFISFGGKTYKFKEYTNSNTVGNTPIVPNTPNDFIGPEKATVYPGTTHVIYVYEEVKDVPTTPEEGKTGSVVVKYEDTEGNEIKSPVKDTDESPVGTVYETADNKPNTIKGEDGSTYYITENPVKPGSADEKGIVEEGEKVVTYVYEKAGDVVVNYKDKDGNVIKDPVEDEKDQKPGSPYDTTDNRPEEIKTPDGKTYKRVPNLTEGEETGEVPSGKKTEVTYVYEEVKGNVVVHYIDIDGNTIKEDVEDTPQTSTGVDYNTADDNKPATIEKDGKTYELVPVLTKGQEQGKVVEGTTEITYVYKLKEEPQPETPAEKVGSVVVKYVNTKGETIATDVNDTVNAKVGSDYDTTDYKPAKIYKDGKTYVYKEVQAGSVAENGTIVEGTQTVTYVYEEEVPTTPEVPQEPGSYIPYVPKDPKNPDPNDPDSSIEIPKVPYDETPEDPSNNPPLPHVPGYEPKDPNDPTGKTPLKPVDPNDPTKGYIPPTITDPNDPTKDTPVPYTPVGSVVVRYKDTDGNVIKEQVTDTPTSDVDTPYDTTDNKPTEITYKGDKYVLVPSKTEGEESGKVVKGETVITYVYQKVGNWIPEIPGIPGKDRPKLPYPFDPEDPNEPVNPNDPNTPPIPHVPGYTPNDPDGNPLKPVDPNDPTKGYIPPVPTNPGEDTPIPYVPNTPEKPDTPKEPNTPDVPGTPEKPGTPDTPDTPSPKSPESPMTPTASTRRNGSDKYMAKGVENLPNTGETSNYVGAVYGGMAIGLAALLASKKRKRDSED